MDERARFAMEVADRAYAIWDDPDHDVDWYYRQSETACCPRETIPDSCSCPDGCGCLCADCDCGCENDD